MKFDFFRNKAVIAVSVLLAIQIIVFKVYPTGEIIPSPPPLGSFKTSIGPWQMAAQMQIDQATQDLLKADDTLSRAYAGPVPVDFFVAFFKTQRSGVSPHSPKVCLPGNGWNPETSQIIKLDLPAEGREIEVNRFLVRNGEQRKLVLYWYQNTHRVTASEYLSKLYLMWDSLRYHRSDEAMIRVIVDITPTTSESAALEYAKQFSRQVFTPLKEQMWDSSATNAAVLLP